eukprot:jgi/Chlat1/5044/Chrsp33S05050
MAQPQQVIIKHVVLFKFKKDTPEQKIASIMTELSQFPNHFQGCLEFSGGKYSSPEGLNKDFTHAFCMTFDSVERRDEYALRDQKHEKLKGEIVPLVEGGIEGIISFDWVEPPMTSLTL